MNHEIDAKNQVLGRLASKIAVLLRGKTRPSYQANAMPSEKITVINVSEMKFTGNKLKQKTYYHYSGYPGGMKAKKLDVLMAQDPKRVLRLAVYRMLAQNRLRGKLIKNLLIK